MGMKKQWVCVGKEATITKPECEDLQRRVATFAQRYCPKQAPSLDTKARGRLFYIGQKIRGVVLPLCRLEKCDDNQWTLGFAAGFSNPLSTMPFSSYRLVWHSRSGYESDFAVFGCVDIL